MLSVVGAKSVEKLTNLNKNKYLISICLDIKNNKIVSSDELEFVNLILIGVEIYVKWFMFKHFCLKSEFEYPQVFLIEIQTQKFSLFIVSRIMIKT